MTVWDYADGHFIIRKQQKDNTQNKETAAPSFSTELPFDFYFI